MGLFVLGCAAAQLGCSKRPAQSAGLLEPGTLHGSISVQVTAAENKRFLFLDAADMAELLAPAVRRGLKDQNFKLQTESARQHLIIHVAQAARGSGNVNAFCKLEVYLYPDWPGTLESAKNPSQAADGSLPQKSPLLHFSLHLKDQRRLRLAPSGKLLASADYFAQAVATELASIRARTLPPPAPAVATSEVQKKEKEPKPDPKTAGFEVAFALQQPPGNLTLTPSGQLLVSLHPFFSPAFPVARVGADGKLEEFASQARLDSVLGIQSDENGVVWMLDSGRKATKKPRLVGWHSIRDKLVADIDLSGVGPDDAFFNDLVIDLDHQYAYLAEPAGGDNAALVVVDLVSGQARRLLEGHPSVVPEEGELIVDGAPLEVERPDGSVVHPRVGVNPIAADADNTWLYFGPMHGKSLYRIQTASLRNDALTGEHLASAVERFADKPICDGISVDRAGNIYLGALSENAIWKIAADGSSNIVARDKRLSWVNAFSFGPDGKLYAVANQLHRSAALHRGQDTTVPPFLIISLASDSGGVIGR